jgi:hypothetical protein
MGTVRRVTDAQVKELRAWLRQGSSLKKAARKADMDRKSARKYREGPLPSEVRAPRTWRTRPDPLAGVWAETEAKLSASLWHEATFAEWPGPGRGERAAAAARARDGAMLRTILEEDDKTPRSQVAARLRDLTFGSMTSLGPIVIGSCRVRSARAAAWQWNASLFAEGV